MLGKFTLKGKDTIAMAQKIAKNFGHGFVGTEHILLALLRVNDCVAQKILESKGVSDIDVECKILMISPAININGKQPQSFTPKTKKIIELSFHEALKVGSDFIGTEHILLAILNEKDTVALKILIDLKIDVISIKNALLVMLGGIQKDSNSYTPMANKNGQEEKSSTPTLDKYSRDFTKLAKENKFDPIIGRDKEIDRLIQILSRRTKNNPVLLGDPGVGKTAIVEGLAQKIADGIIPEILKGKKVVCLDLSSMVAGSKYRGEFEDRIKKVMAEIILQKDIIIFIDELHTIIGAGGAEGAMDASNILKPALSRGEIQVIGATTITEYRKHIQKDAALERRFQQILIDEPSEIESIEMLKILRDKYEAHHNVTITDNAIESAVKLSTRYIQDRFLPDKAIDIIDEASSKVKLRAFTTPPNVRKLELEIAQMEFEKESAVKQEKYEKARDIKSDQQKLITKLEKELKKWEKLNSGNVGIVDEKIIGEIIGSWTGIPVENLQKKDAERLMSMEKLLHERVVGQDEAVTAISKAIRRSRVGLKDPKRPIGSFLFLGPTGVGKTELSKALAEVLFGDESFIIRVDMSEYMEKHSVSKMIGSPPGYVGYEEGGQLSEKIRRKPYSIILIDEIEKAHPDVFNILLQILDDGHITDSQGRKVDFKNTVIIMTSNVGGKNIVEPKHLGFSPKIDIKKDYEKMKSSVMDEVKKLFKPEFLNRIDEMVVFHPLSQDDIKKIAKMLIEDVVKKAKENVKLNLKYTDKVVSLIAQKGYSNIYGARPLKRTIQNELEDYLSEQILSNNIVSNDNVNIDVKEEKIIFSK